MTSDAKTVEEYLASLPDDRREAIVAVREAVKAAIQPGFVEGMLYGGPCWYVPHSTYPAGYHCDPKIPVPFMGYASQKNHLGIYLFCVYVEPGAEQRFREAWLATGKKLDMGKSCVRFKRISDVPLEVVQDTLREITVERFLAAYEATIPPSKRKK
jgi:hypothetical protein